MCVQYSLKKNIHQHTCVFVQFRSIQLGFVIWYVWYNIWSTQCVSLFLWKHKILSILGCSVFKICIRHGWWCSGASRFIYYQRWEMGRQWSCIIFKYIVYMYFMCVLHTYGRRWWWPKSAETILKRNETKREKNCTKSSRSDTKWAQCIYDSLKRKKIHLMTGMEWSTTKSVVHTEKSLRELYLKNE